MSTSGGGAKEIAVPVTVLHALRSQLKEVAGPLGTVRALHHAGYQAGLASAATVHREAGGDAFALSRSAFWNHLSHYLSKRGWGSLAHSDLHPAVGVLETKDWAEVETDDPSDDASCGFSAGYLSGLLSQLAGGPVAVLEVACRARGDDACRFAFGSETAIHDLYGHLLEGDDVDTALEALSAPDLHP